MPMRLIQASSPLESRYKEWIKQCLGHIWVMDPWSPLEVKNVT
jgi:hypothetical protein